MPLNITSPTETLKFPIGIAERNFKGIYFRRDSSLRFPNKLPKVSIFKVVFIQKNQKKFPEKCLRNPQLLRKLSKKFPKKLSKKIAKKLPKKILKKYRKKMPIDSK